MGDSLITIVAIFLAAILMFVFPLSAISEMNDSEVLAAVQSYTAEFVANIRTTGKITKDDYEAFEQKLYATGNSYNIEMEVQIADANPGKKSDATKVGDTVYYSEYSTQIKNILDTKEVYNLKQGDYINVYIKNTNTTISQMIKGVLYSVTGNESYVISAQASGTVVVTAN